MITPIQPQKCRGNLRPEMWTDPDYWAEFKFHGERFLMYIERYGNKFLSRHISVKGGYVDKSSSLPHLSNYEYRNFKGTILDGEIILNLFGTVRDVTSILGSKPELAIQKQEERGYLKYMVFDIPYYCGNDIREYTYARRRTLLHSVLRALRNNYIIEVPYYNRAKKVYYNSIVHNGGEGIVLKYSFSKYGERRHWIKVKKSETFDVVIVGVLKPSEESTKIDGTISVTRYAEKGWIGSLLIGLKDGEDMRVVGSVSGMDEMTRARISKDPEKFIGKVIEIEAQSQLPSGKFEHPRFIRFRPDKEAEECVYEGK